MHTTVFLQEAVEALDVRSGEKYIDATYGQGGHAQEIIRRGGQVLGIDADPNQILLAKNKGNVINGNFANIEEIAKKNSFYPAAGVIFDFGLSMDQIRGSGKGFSYQAAEENLDMRFSGKGMTAAEYLSEGDANEIRRDLVKYSEEIKSPAIAEAIIRFRAKKDITKVGDLLEIINSNKRVTARIFQALRIIVNDELNVIQKGLEGALAITKSTGRIVVISFHSLEDRIVKQFIKSNYEKVTGELVKIASRRPLAAFERSAKLRVIKIL